MEEEEYTDPIAFIIPSAVISESAQGQDIVKVLRSPCDCWYWREQFLRSFACLKSGRFGSGIFKFYPSCPYDHYIQGVPGGM
jgi:hypothetical protein